MGIAIDLGLRTYDLEDADGNLLGTIRLNPSDIGLAARWEEARDAIQRLSAEAASINTPAGLRDMERSIREQLDYAMASSVSEVVFRQVSALAICPDGSFVVEHVLEGLLPIIEDAIRNAAEASQARISARTQKYQERSAGLAPGQH